MNDDLGNHYEILGVAKDATLEEITAAFRKLAKAYHPDTNPTPIASRVMSRINLAYEVLSDTANRRLYDMAIQAKATAKPAATTSHARGSPAPGVTADTGGSQNQINTISTLGLGAMPIMILLFLMGVAFLPLGRDDSSNRDRHADQDSKRDGGPVEGRAEQIKREMLMSRIERPEVQSYLKARATNSAEVSILLRQLGLRGLARLNLSEIDEWTRLRLLVATGSTEACAAMWLGTNSIDLDVQLDKFLAEEDLRSWYGLIARALDLEIGKQNVTPKLSRRAVTRALRLIERQAPRHERRQFQATIGKQHAATASEACHAMLFLLRGAQALPDKLREPLLKAMSSTGLEAL